MTREPKEQSMTDQAPAFIRTYVPLVVGAAVTWAATRHGIVLDEATSQAATIAATGIASAVYYGLVRVLEARFPAFGVLLGYTAQPSYSGDPVDGRPADMAHEPIRVPAIVGALLLAIGSPLVAWLISQGYVEAAAAVGGIGAAGGLLTYTESRRARVDSPATIQERHDAAIAVEDSAVASPYEFTAAGLPIRFETPAETAEFGINQVDYPET